MKNKILWIFLLGIGMGIVFSSSISILTQSKITEDFIRQEATKLGMIDPKDYFDKSFSENDPKEEFKSSGAEKEQKHEDKIVLVKIPKGMTSKEIAAVLKENNLISSEDIFLKKAYSEGLTNKIRWGNYKISVKLSEDEIIEKIIKGEFE